jgi:hypothetical protein
VVSLVDDLDGGPADETVRFGINGSQYEIDLSEKNANKLRQRMAPFVDHARQAGSRARRLRRTAASRRRSADIRAWARDQGIELSERGRLPAGVTEQYQDAVSRRSSRRLRIGPRPVPGRVPEWTDPRRCAAAPRPAPARRGTPRRDLTRMPDPGVRCPAAAASCSAVVAPSGTLQGAHRCNDHGWRRGPGARRCALCRICPGLPGLAGSRPVGRLVRVVLGVVAGVPGFA